MLLIEEYNSKLPADSRWTVFKVEHTWLSKDTNTYKVRARCTCGAERIVWVKDLLSGASISCGCPPGYIRLKPEELPATRGPDGKLLKKTKVIIAGSHTFNSYNFLKRECDKLLSSKPHIEIVTGDSLGADRLAERYAREKKYLFKKIPAPGQGQKFPGYEVRVRYADMLIAFWNGRSQGTKIIVECAKRQGLDVTVFNLSLTH